MLSSAGYPLDSVGNLRVNILWAGLLHASTYAFTAAGLALLWRYGCRTTSAGPESSFPARC